MSDTDAANQPRTYDDRVSVTTHESATLRGGMRWTATAGTWWLRDSDDKPKCSMSFVSYVRDDAPSGDRPVTFVFNGGPGSCAVWLHLGVFGPRRLDTGDGVTPVRPSQRVVDNPHTLLHVTDLVFIDPVATGFSRLADGEERKDYLGVEADVRWVGEFVRLYLARTGRWSSPVYVVGESYGTMRAALLAEHLVDKHGLAVSGVGLISSILLFQTLYPAVGNDLPYALTLPTMAATAWHHGLSDPDLGSLDAVVDAAVELATGDYATLLLREHLATPAEREEIAQRLSRLIGVSADVLLRNRLRLSTSRFRKELRRADGIVGHFDGRLLGHDDDTGHADAGDDPSFWAVRSPYTTAYLGYLREELGVDDDSNYVVLDAELGRDWKWQSDDGWPKYPDAASGLRRAMLRDPGLRVLLASGVYDFATPFYAAEWTLDHLGLPAERRKNITTTRYKGGHMMYTDEAELTALARDVETFLT